MKTTLERVSIIIRHIKDSCHEVTPEMNLTEDLWFDSLDLLMLVNAIEAEFSVTVNMDMVERVKTVGDIIHYLEDVKNSAHEK